MDFHSCSEVTTDTKCHRGQITCFDIQQEGLEAIIYIHRCYHENIQVLIWCLTRIPSTAYPRGFLLTFLILSPPGSCCELIWQKTALLPFGKPRQQWQNRTDSIWLCVRVWEDGKQSHSPYAMSRKASGLKHTCHTLSAKECVTITHTHTSVGSCLTSLGGRWVSPLVMWWSTLPARPRG